MQIGIHFLFYIFAIVILLSYVQMIKIGLKKYWDTKVICVQIWRKTIKKICLAIVGVLKKLCCKIGSYVQKETKQINEIHLADNLTKKVLLVAALNLVMVVLCAIYSASIFWIPCVCYGVFSALVIVKGYQCVKKEYDSLLSQVHKMSDGNLSCEVQSEGNFFEEFATELNRIRFGFKKALEEEVKSDKMKTELITNVSHDLKTPLTAIITYVDLLKNPELPKEERMGYVNTLEQKSGRLKQLIEDLFEMSKANTKNLEIVPVEVDLAELIKQASVEYKEKIEEAGIELRFKMPKEKIVLMLDSQKTFRIFENLFINLYKYSMPFTRAYIKVEEMGNRVMVEMKNISKTEMDFDDEQIMERFVRGDLSRNTEGSGLGLAIVNSFANLQGGSFHIKTDGDLFKAVLTFPKKMQQEKK